MLFPASLFLFKQEFAVNKPTWVFSGIHYNTFIIWFLKTLMQI